MKTAGETALVNIDGATYEERKEYMQKCLAGSEAAFLVYMDEDCEVRTMGVAKEGFESMLLPLLDAAAYKARQLGEEAML